MDTLNIDLSEIRGKIVPRPPGPFENDCLYARLLPDYHGIGRHSAAPFIQAGGYLLSPTRRAAPSGPV